MQGEGILAEKINDDSHFSKMSNHSSDLQTNIEITSQKNESRSAESREPCVDSVSTQVRKKSEDNVHLSIPTDKDVDNNAKSNKPSLKTSLLATATFLQSVEKFCHSRYIRFNCALSNAF